MGALPRRSRGAPAALPRRALGARSSASPRHARARRVVASPALARARAPLGSRAQVITAEPHVCELDLIFNFHKAYHILDELLICGELQEPSKKAILRVTAAQDALMEGSGDSKVSDSKYEI